MAQENYDLFRESVDEVVKSDHPLCVIAKDISWLEIENRIVESKRSQLGRPSHSARLVIGFFLLKKITSLSDEKMLKQLSADAYFQYFCGISNLYEADQKPLFTRTSVSKWRRRYEIEKIYAGIEEELERIIRNVTSSRVRRDVEAYLRLSIRPR